MTIRLQRKPRCLIREYIAPSAGLPVSAKNTMAARPASPAAFHIVHLHMLLRLKVSSRAVRSHHFRQELACVTKSHLQDLFHQAQPGNTAAQIVFRAEQNRKSIGGNYRYIPASMSQPA